MKDDQIYLAHILEAIEKIEHYTVDGRESFQNDSRTQDAVLRNFEIIGEATKQLSNTTRNKHPEIPWKRIAGFRDVLIHDYMGVDLDEEWNVVVNHLPPLHKAIIALQSD